MADRDITVSISNKEIPSVGRVVHYVTYVPLEGGFLAKAHRAAIVTAVENEDMFIVSLCILNPTGMDFTQHVHYDPTAVMFETWHWPERV